MWNRVLLSYRVDFKVPWLSRLLEVDDDFFIGEVELFEGDVGAVGVGAEVVGVEGYFGRHTGAVGLFDCCVHL